MLSVAAAELRRAAHLPHLIAIFLLPVLVTTVLPDWVYTLPGAIDAWVYNGYFRHLDVYAEEMFNDLYYGTRLAWLLPGHAAYVWFDATTANFVFHLSYYIVALVTVYAIVTAAVGHRRALFAAVTFALYLPTIRTFGEDYVAAGVIAYALLACLALVHGARRYGPAPGRADIFRVVDQATRLTERFLDTKRPRYLMTAEPALTNYMTAVTSVYLWQYSIVSSDFPRVTPDLDNVRQRSSQPL